MNRGMIGVTPRPTTLADESYLEFITSFRRLAIQQMFPKVAEHGEVRLAQAMESGAVKAENGTVPLEEIQRIFGENPVTPTFQRFVRTQQEMMWRRTRESFVRDADSLMAWMEEAAAKAPERLHIDPDFTPPEYTRREIHCQPGGYTDDPLGGVVYHYGTKVFYEGFNDQDELHAELVERATPPADGKVERVLDIGCSIGQATTLLKDRFPEAEVWGLDVGEPMIRYAHARALDHGKEVHFKQALAEDTGFDADSFDMVLSYIVFHEVPVQKMREILAETYRVLRPGGTFTIYEFPSNDKGQVSASTRFLVDYDSRNNCEPYSPDFVAADFRGIIAEAGFEVADGPGLSNTFLQSIVATKPA
ncbi:class I SAM-dependent methyltransferase [Erythrobacter sp.]|uniref:class I SAM-dependent methyltransferase n=1 Tax=Erythrobacter sp. TaxID=1042 RepID=UPI001426029F|nr:class I SAM-dependent methyltransferase [Erythrobacter sp.]QIQ86577.1 MAG: class I SAM-dependent methyltransferase [Erythrobacter sp.]